MKSGLLWTLATVGAGISPVIYVGGEILDARGILKIAHDEFEDWVQIYNDNLTWSDKNYQADNSEAILAKVVKSWDWKRVKGVALNLSAKYSTNRQLGIQVIGKRGMRRSIESSPYRVVLTSAGGGGGIGGNIFKHKSLGSLDKKIHVIEWEGTNNQKDTTNYKGVLAVSFISADKLRNIIEKTLDEKQPYSLWDIDVRDILKKSNELDYSFGNSKDYEKINGLSYLLKAPDIAQQTSNLVNDTLDQKIDESKEKLLVQELLNNTNWLERLWYKGTDLLPKDEIEDEEGEDLDLDEIQDLNPTEGPEELEVSIPDKYYMDIGNQKWIGFTEDHVKRFLQVDKEENGITIGPDLDNSLFIEAKELTLDFLSWRRNRNIQKNVIKHLFRQENLSDAEIKKDKQEYSLTDLLAFVKRKFILDKFKGLDQKCSGNLIGGANSFSGGVTVQVGGENDGKIGISFGDDDDDKTNKFCEKWYYPIVDASQDEEVVLAETVWDELKYEFESSPEKIQLCEVLQESMMPYLNAINKNKKEGDFEECWIYPKMTAVTKYKQVDQRPIDQDFIDTDLVHLRDKFGMHKSFFESKQFNIPAGVTGDNLVPIIWSSQSFLQTIDPYGKKSWKLNSNYSITSAKDQKDPIIITKIKEWR